VFYDSYSIQKGKYKRDGFYFEVEPFQIDSLDNFNKKNLKFQGTLISGGIFPDIKEPLVLMEDNSLGFQINTTDSGFQAYGGKAKVTGDLTLNFSGLKGKGKLGGQHKVPRLSNDRQILDDILALAGIAQPNPGQSIHDSTA
jgi:hypothetical protein